MCPFNEFIRTNLQQNKIIHFLFLNLNDWAENFINELCTGSRSLNWDRRIVAMDQTHQTNLNYPYYFYFSQSKCVFFIRFSCDYCDTWLKNLQWTQNKTWMWPVLFSTNFTWRWQWPSFYAFHILTCILCAIGICFGLVFAAANDNGCVWLGLIHCIVILTSHGCTFSWYMYWIF